jgi:hypothetical protein
MTTTTSAANDLDDVEYQRSSRKGSGLALLDWRVEEVGEV